MTAEDANRLNRRIDLKLSAMADAYQGVMPMIREAIDREATRLQRSNHHRKTRNHRKAMPSQG